MSAPTMTKGERANLERLTRQRAKVEKQLADQRKAEILADFEDALLHTYSYDDDEVWKEAAERAEEVAREARETIAQRCAELGIPKEFAPRLSVSWYGQGRNASREERSDLRRQARMRLDAMAKRAKVEIDRASVETQTKLVADGLTSEAAKAFLEDMPTIRGLIPDLEDNEVRALLPGGNGAGR